MKAFVISDHEPTTRRIREALLRNGHDCPAANVLTLGQAADRLAHAQPELVILALGPHPELAQEVLAQIHQVSPSPVLAVGPTGDTRLVLRALRSGAEDFIDEAEVDGELPAAIARLRRGAGGQAEPARTIAVLAPSGGSGSSTLAVNIATVLAKKYQRTLLVDLKLHAGDLAPLLDLRPTHTLAELCQQAAHMDRTMFERSLARHDSGVHLLAPPRFLTDVAYVTPDGLRQTLTLARTLFPFVVLDLDHSFGPEQELVLRQADIILLVLRLDFTCLRNTQRVFEYLDQLGVDRGRVRVVVNRYGQAKEVPAGKAEEALGVKVHHYVPDDTKTVNRANNSGVPVVLESPSAKVAKSLTALAASVNGRHPG
jgi:pilus assembly protein CpaE